MSATAEDTWLEVLQELDVCRRQLEEVRGVARASEERILAQASAALERAREAGVVISPLAEAMGFEVGFALIERQDPEILAALEATRLSANPLTQTEPQPTTQGDTQ